MAAITNLTLGQVIADLAYVFEGATQVPVLEDTISFDTGGVTKSEIKLTTKQIVSSTIDKDDSDISYDVVVNKPLTSSEQTVQDALGAESLTANVSFVTRDKNVMITLPGATLTRSYQLSGDGVFVQHTIVTPSASGMTIKYNKTGDTDGLDAPTA